jgi:hypothetical protein
VSEWIAANWRDALAVIGVAATVAAAVLAWLAIVRGNKQASEAAAALVRERRLDFELDQLDRMGEALEKGYNVAFTLETITRGLRLLPGNDLPRMRARYLANSTPEAMRELQAVNESVKPGGSIWDAPLEGGLTYKAALREEIQRAIASRLAARG